MGKGSYLEDIRDRWNESEYFAGRAMAVTRQTPALVESKITRDPLHSRDIEVAELLKKYYLMVDLRSRGGCLWLEVSYSQFSKYRGWFRKFGIQFNWASGGKGKNKALQGRPGWWTRASVGKKVRVDNLSPLSWNW